MSYIELCNKKDRLVWPPDQIELENVFMKHYAPNHMLAPKKGSSQKGVQLKP